MLRCFSEAGARIEALVLEQLGDAIGGLRPSRVLIKPNWVLHETDPAFPISALVTDARVIEATVRACLEVFPGCDSIVVGDCPLQYADWRLLCRQSGLDPAVDRLTRQSGGKVEFLDLRRKPTGRVRVGSSSARTSRPVMRAAIARSSSGVAATLRLSGQERRFAVNDYSARVTHSNHRPGSHRYLVCQSVLDCDLFINLPKWKTHQKAGLTCALKNIVGINGDKAYLPHFRRGAPKWGGDEYRDDNRWLYFAQTSLRELSQKRSRLAYQLLKPGWELIKKVRGIETELKNPAASANFYIAGGAWHGNETLWRMIYDLNLVLQCADAEGNIRDAPQRSLFCIVDGLVCGEGNGPLQPLARPLDRLAFGDDPFLVDAAIAWWMGFDLERLPLIARRDCYAGPEWGRFDLAECSVEVDGDSVALLDPALNFHFVPPPGWKGFVER